MKKTAFLTRPTLARRDAPFPMLRSRLIEILNVPHLGKELFRQLGVGRVRSLACLNILGFRNGRSDLETI
jgi:hypothetical protein